MRFLAAAFVMLMALPAIAGEADVLDVRVIKEAGGTYRFDVTVQHADTGWDHYADGWKVATEDGVQLGYRTLYHPHVNEQPFTRSLGGVSIPMGIERVVIRAHDSVDGWGGRAVLVVLPD
jgi:hypothetical protein